jgi:hypothetical protein
MKLTAACVAVLALAFGQTLSAQRAGSGPGPRVQNPIVIQLMIDGVDANTLRTAIAAGAKTVGGLVAQSTITQTYYCASPAARLQLPDGSLPEGGSAAAIVALHTGTHLFESPNIDDIFPARTGPASSR